MSRRAPGSGRSWATISWSESIAFLSRRIAAEDWAASVSSLRRTAACAATVLGVRLLEVIGLIRVRVLLGCQVEAALVGRFCLRKGFQDLVQVGLPDAKTLHRARIRLTARAVASQPESQRMR